MLVDPAIGGRLRRRPGSGRPRRREGTGLAAWLFVAPAMLLIGTFQLYPLLKAVQISGWRWDGVADQPTVVGLTNYWDLLHDPTFLLAARNAIGFGTIGLALGGLLGLTMALLVNTQPRGAAFFRAVYFLPWILSPVVYGYVWRWLLDPSFGPFNKALVGLGQSHLVHAWLGEVSTAFLAVALIYVWAHWGLGFLLYLAGLQNIPGDLLEAAAIDGAGAWNRFRHVIWPLLLPVTVVVAVLTLLLALQIFGTILVTTNGGPGYLTEVPTLRIYKEAFQFFRVGTASAMTVSFGLSLLALSLIQLLISRRVSVE